MFNHPLTHISPCFCSDQRYRSPGFAPQSARRFGVLLTFLLVIWQSTAVAATPQNHDDWYALLWRDPAQVEQLITLKLQDPQAASPQQLALWHTLAAHASQQLLRPRDVLKHATAARSLLAGASMPGLEDQLRLLSMLAEDSLGLADHLDSLKQWLESERQRPESAIYPELAFAYALRLDESARMQEAISVLQQAYLRAPDSSPALVRKVDLQNVMAFLNMHIGEYSHAQELFADSVQRYTAANNPFGLAITQFQMAVNLANLGDLPASVQALNQVQQAATHIGALGLAASIALVRAEIRIDLKQLNAANADIRYAANFFDPNGGESEHAYLARMRAKLATQQGNYALAASEFSKAVDLARSRKNPMAIAYMERERAELLDKSGQTAQAYGVLRNAVELLDKAQESEKLRAIAEMRVQFDIEREQHLNTQLRQENTLKQTRIEQQRQQLWLGLSLLASLITLLALGGYAFWRDRQVRRKMTELAMTDELTRLPNRRYWLQLAHLELERTRRQDIPLCLAMLDIDHFKLINDEYGHALGDEVLKALAGYSRNCLRKTDLIARWGGEEFVLLMPHTAPEAAHALLDRLRSGLSTLRIPNATPELRISVSIGIANLLATDTTLEELIERADTALYNAKSAGRNRVARAA